MNKEFIPYEQALALKELGFDEPCLGWYLPEIADKGNTPSVILGAYVTKWNKFGDRLSAPTFSQAFRWFREKYDLQHTITWNKHYPKTPYEWEVRKSWRDEPLRPYGISGMSATYEEAEQACLNKLIEIVKNENNR